MMGLLKLLTSPVTGPVRAGWWVFERVVAAAEAERYDEDRIIAHLRAATADLEAGRISEREHAEVEAELLERLRLGRARRAADREVVA